MTKVLHSKSNEQLTSLYSIVKESLGRVFTSDIDRASDLIYICNKSDHALITCLVMLR